MKFKVGDKIKTIKSFFIRKRAEMLGTVDAVYPDIAELQYRIKMEKNWSCPVHECEIEKVTPTKGQQLVFPFMEQ